jgi:glycosyltransferase involved in cell wall biosynthesis
MKIIQVIDTLNIGGAERMCVNISNLLTSKSIDNSIVVTRKQGPLSKQVDANRINLISKKHGLDIKAFYRFFKIIKIERPDVIHAHSTSVYWSVVLKIIFPRLKLIWHDHLGGRPNEKNPMLKLILNKIDIVLAINDFNYLWYLKNTRRQSTNLFYIPNFPFIINPNIKRDSKFIRIVHVANLHAPKDHFTHIRAIGELVKGNKIKDKIAVHFIGNFSDLIYLEKVNELIENLNLKEIITLTGPKDDIAYELFNADIGVLSSTSEGLPVALLEYGLAGLAVVVTNVGQCSAVIGQGEFGKLIDKGNHCQLAYELLKLIESDSERVLLGNKFKSHVENEFGGESFYKDYNRIID